MRAFSLLGRGFPKKFTQLVILIVSVVGLASTALLVSDPMTQYDLTAEAQAVMAASLPTAPPYGPMPEERSVASVPETENVSKTVNQVVTAQVDCQSQNQTIETESPRMRLYASGCGELTDVMSLTSSIRNETNGFVATIFRPKDQLFTTDFINLNEGENRIVIHLEDSKKQVETILQITRKPASL